MSAGLQRLRVPVSWVDITRDRYHEMLNVLPPAAWVGGDFLVGEAVDDCPLTGRVRFAMFREVAGGRFLESSRAVTVAEFRAIHRGAA